MSTLAGRELRERAYSKMVSCRDDSEAFHVLLTQTATDLVADNPGKYFFQQEAYEAVARGLWHFSTARYGGTTIHEEVKQSILTLLPNLI